MADTEAALRAIANMGDPVELGRRIGRLHRPWLNTIFMAAGLALLFSALCLTTSWGLQLNYFIDPAGFIYVLLLTAAFVMMGGALNISLPNILTRVQIAAIYAGALTFLIGLITILHRLNDPATLGPSISMALVGLFFGTVLSVIANMVLQHVRPVDAAEISEIVGR